MPDDPGAAAAEGETDRDLFASRGAAREQHIGQVQTRDEQHHPRHSSEERTDSRHEPCFRRIGDGIEAKQWCRHKGLILLFDWKCRLQVCCKNFERRGRGLRRDSRLEPADEHQIVNTTISERIGLRASQIVRDIVLHSEGQPDFRRKHAGYAGESFRHDADDGKRAAIDQERLAQQRRIL